MKGWIVSAMTVLLATVTAVFADTEVVDGIEWTYTVSDGKVRIDGISYSTAGDITIPSELGGYPVSQIRDYAFRWREGLTSVAIPDSVTSIGNYAFSDCTGLTSVTIPGSVTRTSAVTFDAVSGTTYHIAVGGYDTHSGGIVLSWEPEDEDELIPSVDEDADAEAVAAAIEAIGFADEAAIMDAVAGSAASYNAFVAWARDVIGDESAVIMSPYAANSYLLGADELVADDITSENVQIVSFDVSNDAGDADVMQFTLEVAINGVNIGAGSVEDALLKENLETVFAVEGAAVLAPDAFSSDNIDMVADTPIDGKARFRATRRAGGGFSGQSDKAFFMRVKVR